MRIRTLLVLLLFSIFGGVSFGANPTYSVILSWTSSTDSTSTNPGTVNVYRFTGSCPATPTTTGFTQIATNQAAAGSFTDSVVNLGTTYCYFVTAVIGGLESNPSITFQGSIPAQPQPPGLTGKITHN